MHDDSFGPVGLMPPHRNAIWSPLSFATVPLTIIYKVIINCFHFHQARFVLRRKLGAHKLTNTFSKIIPKKLCFFFYFSSVRWITVCLLVFVAFLQKLWARLGTTLQFRCFENQTHICVNPLPCSRFCNTSNGSNATIAKKLSIYELHLCPVCLVSCLGSG